jgi:hypothetical protein
MVGCLSWGCRRALTLSLGGEAFALHLFRAMQTERVRLPGNASASHCLRRCRTALSASTIFGVSLTDETHLLAVIELVNDHGL